MSLHTLAIDRGLSIGAHLFAAKMEHHIEFLGQDEVLIVAESPIGFRRWMIEYGLEPTTIPHELGGAPSYRLTRAALFRQQSTPGRRRSTRSLMSCWRSRSARSSRRRISDPREDRGTEGEVGTTMVETSLLSAWG
jgi:hypothetical protein